VLIESDISNRFLNVLARFNARSFPKPNSSLVIDNDVLAEEKRVEMSGPENFKIRVKQLRKVYMTGKGPCNRGKPFLAVENISFGLSAGECFALLGVNGAGKSTTFKSLTSEVQPTSGSIEINGINIMKNFSAVRKYIGYCPQTNPIFDEMSVEEHLYYYARIKGIPRGNIKELVEEAISELDLETHRKKQAGTLSGGNKRKLSVAMAIVGRPPIILLDEPSAGMDPEARRFMWSVVAKIASNKTSAVILTTHSMEEAEALSTKMGIMVKGGIFKCFGSAQHIRNKFGQGYIIEVKIKHPTKEDIEQITSEFTDTKS
jgi:ATP-binding cassette subfamily A (ABC1) protein 3